MGMPDFDKVLNLRNTQAEYSRKLVTYSRNYTNANSMAKAPAMELAFA